jgi:hypothetical protein
MPFQLLPRPSLSHSSRTSERDYLFADLSFVAGGQNVDVGPTAVSFPAALASLLARRGRPVPAEALSPNRPAPRPAPPPSHPDLVAPHRLRR